MMDRERRQEWESKTQEHYLAKMAGTFAIIAGVVGAG